MCKILVVGSINNDLVINSPKPPRMGETVTGDGFMTTAGGKGANQAVAAARLGADVTMIGAVGDDLFGTDLKANLEKNKINTRFVSTNRDYPTGTAVIVLHQGDNFIILDQGANQSISPDNIRDAEDVFKSADMLIVQLEIPPETVRTAMELAKKHNVRTLLNPAPAQNATEDLIALADILTPNESECETISGIQVKNKDDAFQAVRYFMDKGVNQVCVTLGENGVVYNSDTNLIHVPSRKVEIVEDTTAAGDSFTAALATALCSGKTIDDAIQFATIAASITVTKKGAQPSLPYISDIMKMI